MTITIAERIGAALTGPTPKQCPIKDEPLEGHEVRELPDNAKKLVVVWFEFQTAAHTYNSRSGNDRGVWFRHNNEAESIKEIVRNIVRVEHELGYHLNIEFYTNWQYSYSGG